MYLNCHSYFSFKYGTISPEELLEDASKKGIRRIALTDINNTSGVLDFFRLAKNHGIDPVAGIDFRNGAEQKFIGIAKNMDGFCELNAFLSHHLHNGTLIPERAPAFNHAFVIYPYPGGLISLRENEFLGIKPADLLRLNFYNHKKQPDKLVVLAPVTFRNKTGFNMHRLLRAMDGNTLLSKLEIREQADPGEVMYTQNELALIYHDYPSLLYNTEKLLEQCHIDFDFGKNKNLKYFTGSGKDDHELLIQLCKDSLAYRYPQQSEKIAARYEKEIGVITSQGFTSYFLINHDIVKYAQQKNYFYVGRGSGANSMVAYLLKITDVDPIELDLYFERFINPSRTNPPDFDIDFSSDERDDVIDYIFYRSPYGIKYKDHVALLATYSEMKDNAVTRELGKVFGLPKAEIDCLLENRKSNETPDHIAQLILKYGSLLYSFPGHLSIHAGGILISDKSIHHYTATILPPKNFPLTQFSMLEAEDVGLYKFDILAQRGLGKVRDAVQLVKKNTGHEIDIHQVEQFKQDEAVRKNLQTANLMGCFYVESPAMRMLLTKLEAKTYLDLVAASSIIRPGVAASGMMREYILRFKGKPPTFNTPDAVYKILHDTFGVMVYQEDVIKVAYYFAGLTFGEADMLRRGMSGKYRGREEFQKVEKKFFDNCREKQYDENVTKEVWRQIESFAGYAFSKGHSASYAVESYQCMYLKTHYPLEYMVAVINNGGGFYGVEFYIHEARQQGATINLPDINKSEYLSCIYGRDIYLGLHLVAELESNTSEKILAERARNENYSSLENFMKRVSISIDQLRLLIRIGGFRFTGRTKKQLLWDIHSILGGSKKTEVRNELFEVSNKKFQLPDLYNGKYDDAFDELEMLGFTLISPFDMLAKAPPRLPGNETMIAVAADFKKHFGKIVSIAGYQVTRKPTRTKKGQNMAFGTFLDKAGKWIDTTHFPDVLQQFPFRGRGCYLITGKVVEEFGFYSLDVVRMELLDKIERFATDSEIADANVN
ncbi:MAG: DNA polymerase III subunit alpha [Bacteroidota bacterium]